MSPVNSETTYPIQTLGAPSLLADVITAFFRNQRGILIAVASFILLLTALIVLAGKSYESRTVFLVRNEASTFPITSFDDHPPPPTVPMADTQIGTEMELLSGVDLHRQVIETLHPGLTRAAVDREVLNLDKHLKVLPIPKTTLIQVSYTAKTREQATATLDVLNKLYLAYRLRIRGSDGAYAFFDQQARHYYQKLQDDQAKLADFSQQYKVTLLADEKDITVHRLSDTHASINENDAAIREAQRKIQSMSSASVALPQRIMTQRRELPDQDVSERLNSVLVDLQNKRVELLTKYHATDRRVQEVDAQIANTTEALKRAQLSKSTEEQSDINPLRQTVDSDLEQLRFRAAGLEARQRSLAAQANAYDANLQELNQITGKYDDLTRNVKEDEDSYDLYAKRREQARIDRTLAHDMIANVVQVSGPALIPQSGMQVLLTIACVYTIGVLFIGGTGILAGLWSSSFHSPWELEAAVDLPVLATIPQMGEGKGRKRGAQTVMGTAPFRGSGFSLNEDDPWRRGAWVESLLDRQPVEQSSSISCYIPEIEKGCVETAGLYQPLVEKLRKIESLHPGKGVIFTFTACTAGEGVTEIVRGLGTELSNYTGKKIAVVSAPEAYDSAPRCVDLAPLQLVGRSTESGEEFLRQWFYSLRLTHDYVLIDCPALNASRTAAVYGALGDGLLLVVEAGKATRTQLRGALAMLSLASVPVIGMALNKRRYPVPAAIYNAI